MANPRRPVSVPCPRCGSSQQMEYIVISTSGGDVEKDLGLICDDPECERRKVEGKP